MTSRDPRQLEYLVTRKQKQKLGVVLNILCRKRRYIKWNSLTVSMKLFCRSIESQREFIEKMTARSQLRTIYNHGT